MKKSPDRVHALSEEESQIAHLAEYLPRIEGSTRRTPEENPLLPQHNGAESGRWKSRRECTPYRPAALRNLQNDNRTDIDPPQNHQIPQTAQNCLEWRMNTNMNTAHRQAPRRPCYRSSKASAGEASECYGRPPRLVENNSRFASVKMKSGSRGSRIFRRDRWNRAIL